VLRFILRHCGVQKSTHQPDEIKRNHVAEKGSKIDEAIA
jgi:hypothetical protein